MVSKEFRSLDRFILTLFCRPAPFRQSAGEGDGRGDRRVLLRCNGSRAGRWLVLAGLTVAFRLQAAAVECETLELPGNYREDGLWSALYAAKNGMVYIGAQAHGGETNFYQYDPKKKAVRHVANMMKLAGEHGLGIRGQAKIHTRFVEDENGIIYFGTGNCGSGPWNIDPRTWGGGHWWAYDPARDAVEHLGLVDRGFSDLYGLAIDRVRHRLYATAWNGHLYILDLRTRITTDAGRVSNWDVCRTIETDDQGNCYGTSDRQQMFKYDAAADRLLDLPVVIPHDPYQWPQNYGRPRLDRKNIWRVAEWSERAKGIYLIEGGASYLSRYDPRQGPHGTVEFLAQMGAPAFSGSHNLPYSTLSMVIGRDHRIYFAPGGSVFDYGFDSEDGGADGEIASYLVAYDPERRQRADYGALVEKKTGRKVLGTQGAACGPDGTLYFFGAVEEPDAKKALPEKVLGRAPFILKLIMVDPRSLVSRSK